MKRIQEYMVKALHEAKVHTSWINPYEAYDEAVRQFVARILNEEFSGPFLQDLRAFQRQVRRSAAQRARADTAENHLAGRPRHLPRNRVVGLQPGGAGQPPSRGLRTPAGIAPGIAGSGGRGRAGSEGTPAELTHVKQDGRIKLYVTARPSVAAAITRDCSRPATTSRPRPRGPGRTTSSGFPGAWATDRPSWPCPALLTHLVPGPEGLPLGAEV